MSSMKAHPIHRTTSMAIGTIDSLPGKLTGKVIPGTGQHLANNIKQHHSYHPQHGRIIQNDPQIDGGSSVSAHSFHSKAIATIDVLPGKLTGKIQSNTTKTVHSDKSLVRYKTALNIQSAPSYSNTSTRAASLRGNMHVDNVTSGMLMNRRQATKQGQPKEGLPKIATVECLPGKLTGKVDPSTVTKLKESSQPNSSQYSWVSESTSKQHGESLKAPVKSEAIIQPTVSNESNKYQKINPIRPRSLLKTPSSKYKLVKHTPISKRHLQSPMRIVQRLTSGIHVTSRKKYSFGKYNKSQRQAFPSVGKMVWKRGQQYSLDDSFDLNRLLGRQVINLSRNKYKYVKGGSSVKRLRVDLTGGYIKRRLSAVWNSASPKLPERNLLKVDKPYLKEDLKCPSQPPRLIMIGGMAYRSSNNKLQRASPGKESRGNRTAVVIRKLNTAHVKTVTVRGVRYRADQSGKVLRRIQTESDSSTTRSRQSLPRLDIGGITYIQTQPGTLVKTPAAGKRVWANKALRKSFITTNSKYKKKNAKKEYCMFYNRFGKCKRGDECPYVHDPERIAVCTRFLRGTCQIDNCPFSHKIAKEKMPVCSYFLKGICNRENCPYLHVNVSQDAAVCQEFLKGYCSLGEKCKKKHTNICQIFLKDGSCPNGKKCRLKHTKRKAKRPLMENDKEPTKRVKVTQRQPATCMPTCKASLVESLPSYICLNNQSFEEHERIPCPTPETVAISIKPSFI